MVSGKQTTNPKKGKGDDRMKRVTLAVMLCVLAAGMSGCCGLKCMKKSDGKQKTEECDKSKKICEGCGNPMAECTCKAEKAEE